MKLIIRASDDAYREAIQNPANDGRLPLARITWGFVTGRGWGFLQSWEQQAIFPAKGTPAGFRNPERAHEPFIIWRVWPTVRDESHQHPNHDYAIKGRYWKSYVWRESWGYKWLIWPRFRWALLDPDIVTYDPGEAADWGTNAGEDW